MVVKRKRRNKRKGTVGSLRPNVPRKTAKPASQRTLHDRMEDLAERVEIVLPEVTARVAALEHLLVELNLCSHSDLRQARAFVKEQEE